MATDEEMYELLKDLPDFACIPLPAHWYEKFKLKPQVAVTPQEFINSAYTIKCATAPKELPPVIIDEPQRNGMKWDLIEVEPVKVEVVEKPIEKKD